MIFAERKITNDEKLLQVRDEWLKRGRIPYFFLREQSTSLLVKGKHESPNFLSFSFLFFLFYPLPPPSAYDIIRPTKATIIIPRHERYVNVYSVVLCVRAGVYVSVSFVIYMCGYSWVR